MESCYINEYSRLETFPGTFLKHCWEVTALTIKDIAERCGVSVSTVSRVLNNHPDVSEAVRSLVMEVVKEVHYVPNSSARDLVKTKSDAIGLVVRGVGNPFFTEVIRSIEQMVGKAGYSLVLHQINSGEDELLAGASLSRSKKLQGLILLGGCFDYDPEKIVSLGVPFVCCSYTNSFGSLKKEEYSSVYIDDQEEAFRAVSTLVEKGHRKIAILLESTHDRSISELRYQGYCKALEAGGVALDEDLVEEIGGYEMVDAYEGMNRLMDRRDDFTAVFAISDALAVAAMKAMHDRGKRVPEDCSVIAIDGIDMSVYTIPTLTTLVQPKEQLGKEAVRILLDMIEKRGGNRHIKLSTTLRFGGSVRSIP